jgi:hypothetical protein
MADIHMLLVYSLAQQELITVERFADGDVAMRRYAEVERDHIKDPAVEIVLVAADSEDTIKQTHASYFRGEVALDQLDLERLLA